jgi:hypothetical protein
MTEAQTKMAERDSPVGMRRTSTVTLGAYRTQCYMQAMTDTEETTRVFKTAWFAKAARKARINDDELCQAIEC